GSGGPGSRRTRRRGPRRRLGSWGSLGELLATGLLRPAVRFASRQWGVGLGGDVEEAVPPLAGVAPKSRGSFRTVGCRPLGPFVHGAGQQESYLGHERPRRGTADERPLNVQVPAVGEKTGHFRLRRGERSRVPLARPDDPGVQRLEPFRPVIEVLRQPLVLVESS